MRIWEKVKPALARFVPKHVNDPFGLVKRMLSSNNRAALFTLGLTGFALLLTPLDWVLQRLERRLKPDRDGTAHHGPHIIICGPARSGTTLVYQVLAQTLNVSYVRNFTVLFSRAPILMSRFLTRKSSAAKNNSYVNYYGKTAGMQAPSEANHLWNQWVDADTSGFRTLLSQQGGDRMARFFTLFSQESGLPTLSKNNNANAFATDVADRLDNTYFICLRRDKLYLAQSLLSAREEINGDIEQSYGVVDAQLDSNQSDPIGEVIKQIDYLEDLATSQQKKMGDERFWIVDYESFCANPNDLVSRVKREILQQEAAPADSESLIPEITNNNKVKNPEIFAAIQNRLTPANQ